MASFDPIVLDRDLGRAADAERRWRRRLRVDPGAGHEPWFENVRWVTTRATFAEVSAGRVDDPMREARRRWVYRLAMARIGQRALVDVRRAQGTVLALEKPEAGAIAANEALQRALAEGDRVRRALWLDGLQTAGPAVQTAERVWGEAQREIASRLGVETPSTLTSPYDHAMLQSECRALLDATKDLATALLAPSEDLATLLDTLMCRNVSGSWPSHLHSRWLLELFAGTPLLEDVAVDLGPLPPLRGAATFMRGLARFGAAWARAASLHAGPYPLAQDATDAEPRRKGALFGALLTDPLFLQSHLDFSRETARSVGRTLARAALAAVRLDAARTLVDLRALPIADARDVLEDAWQVRIDDGLVGVVPRMGHGASERVAGALLAVDDGALLRDRFDEDWFDNPRALRALREAGALPPPLVVARERLDGRARAYTAWIEQLASR